MPTLRIVLALAAILVVVPPVALGQSMAVSVSDPSTAFEPALRSHEIRIIARILGLADSERDALAALYDGHCETLKVRAAEIADSREEALERAQATADFSVANVPKETEDAWKAEAAQAKAAFLDDLKILLTKEQADRWPLVERELRRFKSLDRGRIAGEKLDLIRLVDEHAPAAWKNPDIANLLASYVQSLDAALTRRDTQLDSSDGSEFAKLAHSDRAAAESMWRTVIALRVAVRDINLKTAEQVAALLPEKDAEAFRAETFKAAYPKIAKATRTESYIRAAAALKSLSPQQAADIRAVLDSFDLRIAAVQKEQAALRREQDAETPPLVLRSSDAGSKTATTADGEVITFFSPASGTVDKESPAYKLQLRRFQLESDTKRQVNGLLSADQRDECRQPPIDMLVFGEDDYWGL
jgi:hypothetical protein